MIRFKAIDHEPSKSYYLNHIDKEQVPQSKNSNMPELKTQQSEPLKLLGKFKSVYDPESKLDDSSANNLSLPEVWSKLTHFLGGDKWQTAAKIAEISNHPICQTPDTPDPELVVKVPYQIAMENYFLPIRRDGRKTIIALANPLDESLHELVQFIFGINYDFEILPPDVLELAISSAYQDKSEKKSHGQLKVGSDENAGDNEKLIPKLARQLLRKAALEGASDLHLQPITGSYTVRIRVDGLLKRQLLLPESVSKALIRFFKSLGGMDPTSSLIPQDGRVALKVDNKQFDLRLSTLPVYGSQEKLVIRFLSHSSIFKLIELGFSLDEIHIIRRLASYPSGVILLCGPTGSGKTTTLYSILSELNQEDVSIATVENPVEYNMTGLSQTEINPKAGMTFAKALRALLRQDPDIILIGEIRDEETAEIAMQTALTGHLVFSTLHSNDSLSAIPRLLDLNVPPPILTQALTGIISQRLLRKLCAACKEKVSEPLNDFETAFHVTTKQKPAYRAVGCEKCHYSGYQGRTVITEIIEIEGELQKLLMAGETDLSTLQKALPKKNENLSVSASRLIVSGESSVEESLRVIGKKFWIELAENYGSKIPAISSSLNTARKEGAQIPGVLLVGNANCFSEELPQAIEQIWMQVYFASSPEEAKNSLKTNEHIAFVILEIVDEDVNKVVADVAEYRTAMAWSRLPALLLIPEGREDIKDALTKDGATSKMLSKTLPVSNIIVEIGRALSQNLDFTWGLAESNGQ